MQLNIKYRLVEDDNKLYDLKKSWLSSLTSPQDGMWESFRNQANEWAILNDQKLVGYASINEESQLLQFYLIPSYIKYGDFIFRNFIDENSISSGIVGTNNPVFLSLALDSMKTMKVHTFLFRDEYEVGVIDKKESLKEVNSNDKARIVNFCHYSTGAPKEWLDGYIGDLIEKGEVFFLEQTNEIIGTCEIRKSDSASDFADIGMIVSPNFRRLGYGTFLLTRAKTIAKEWGRIPICSCEKDNIGSLKSIQNSGFISNYRLLLVEF